MTLLFGDTNKNEGTTLHNLSVISTRLIYALRKPKNCIDPFLFYDKFMT